MKHLTEAELIEIEGRRLRLLYIAESQLDEIERRQRQGDYWKDSAVPEFQVKLCEDIRKLIDLYRSLRPVEHIPQIPRKKRK